MCEYDSSGFGLFYGTYENDCLCQLRTRNLFLAWRSVAATIYEPFVKLTARTIAYEGAAIDGQTALET